MRFKHDSRIKVTTKIKTYIIDRYTVQLNKSLQGLYHWGSEITFNGVLKYAV